MISKARKHAMTMENKPAIETEMAIAGSEPERKKLKSEGDFGRVDSSSTKGDKLKGTDENRQKAEDKADRDSRRGGVCSNENENENENETKTKPEVHTEGKKTRDEFSPEELQDLEGTSSVAVRHMTKRERKLVLHKRRLRNRLSAKRSRERRLQTISDLDHAICKVYDGMTDIIDYNMSLVERNEDMLKQISQFSQ